jgi:hypothetical protein
MKYLGLMVVMVIMASLAMVAVVSADDGVIGGAALAPVPPPPHGASNTNGGASSTNWSPVCPLCQTILPYNGELDSPFYITSHASIFNDNDGKPLRIMDIIVKCKVCGYDGSKADYSGIIIAPVTATRLADWGARNWEINKK